MLAGRRAAVPAGPRGSPMSPAESTSAASVPSACPSWPPNRAPPSVATMDCIGPSWPRISSGTRSPIAATMRPATGSHSLRQTGRVWVTHSVRVHACAVRMPDGSAASSSGGQLRMVTVGVEDQLTLWDALRGWLSGDDAVVPREVIYPPNESQQQVDKENAQEFKASQDAAIVSALRALGYPVHMVVKEVDNGLPAAGRLEKGDQITTVDGQAVTSAEKLGALIGAKAKGSTVRIGYLRHGTPGTTTVTVVEKDGNRGIGAQTDEDQPSPYHVAITLDNVGGPSAGLMFTLGIIDKVKSEDLTGGRVVAGTGTIDEEGNVGAIGGIPQKMG